MLTILLFMKAVASSLFEEGAVTVIYIVLMNCKSMLERLSNSYGENLMVLYFNTMIEFFDLGISSNYPGQNVSSCASHFCGKTSRLFFL
jgi:hypothetical protein